MNIPEIKTRNATCPDHGDYESRLLIGIIWTTCPICAKEYQDKEKLEEESKLKAEQAHKLDIMFDNSGIPERFRRKTLSNYTAGTKEQKHNLEFARRYVATCSKGQCALFVGKPGTGKTHIAVGIGIELMANGKTVHFTTIMRAIRRVKETWGKNGESESQAIEALTRPDLLILDEVGVQYGTDFERTILFDVLNERYEKMRPTILISNLAKGELVTYLGERVYDRLREDGGKLLVFDWESHRK